MMPKVRIVILKRQSYNKINLTEYTLDDMYDIYNIVLNNDPYAFMSLSEVSKVYGRFKEQTPV